MGDLNPEEEPRAERELGVLTARELEALMVRQFGENFRDKTFASALGTFRLAEVFDECGLRDPHPKRGSRLEQEGGWGVPARVTAPGFGAQGIWQTCPPEMTRMDALAGAAGWLAAQPTMTVESYGGIYSMTRVLILSRHLTRKSARKREAQLEGWQRTIKDWLAAPQETDAVLAVAAAQQGHRSWPVDHQDQLAVAEDVGVPYRVLKAAHALGDAGVFYTDHVQVEPRRRRFRWAVVSEPMKVTIPDKRGRGFMTS